MGKVSKKSPKKNSPVLICREALRMCSCKGFRRHFFCKKIVSLTSRKSEIEKIKNYGEATASRMELRSRAVRDERAPADGGGDAAGRRGASGVPARSGDRCRVAHAGLPDRTHQPQGLAGLLLLDQRLLCRESRDGRHGRLRCLRRGGAPPGHEGAARLGGQPYGARRPLDRGAAGRLVRRRSSGTRRSPACGR